MAERQRGADPYLSAARPRVLFLGHRFPPDGSGGYELHCASVVGHLRARGHEVRVLVADRSRDDGRGRAGAAGAAPAGAPAGRRQVTDEHLEPPGGEASGVHRSLRWLEPGRRLDRAAAAAFELHNRSALGAELDAFAPDVVCFWRLGEMSLSLLQGVCDRNVPALGYVGDGWLHESAERDPWTPYRAHPVDFAAAATWVFNSRWLRSQTLAAGVELTSSLVVSPGVDRRVFTPSPPRAWRGSLLYAGRLTAAKGADVAVRALAQLPGARLLLVGDGSPGYLAEIESLAASLGVNHRLTRRSAVPPFELASLYRTADAVLSPARWQEPFGLVPLEAMACGVPVVATGTGGSAEYLLAEVNALVVAPEDPAALAGAVTRLASDPGLRARLRAEGLSTAAAHDREESSTRLEQLLCELAARPGSRAGTREVAG